MTQNTSTQKANVTSIYEKGSKEDAGNYQLISLTSVPENIMEKNPPGGYLKANQEHD